MNFDAYALLLLNASDGLRKIWQSINLLSPGAGGSGIVVAFTLGEVKSVEDSELEGRVGLEWEDGSAASISLRGDVGTDGKYRWCDKPRSLVVRRLNAPNAGEANLSAKSYMALWLGGEWLEREESTLKEELRL